MKVTITKENCMVTHYCDTTVTSAVIEADVTEIVPNMFAYCRNLRTILNYASEDVLKPSTIAGCNWVEVKNMGQPKPQVTATASMSDFLIGVEVDKIYFAISPEKRSKYGKNKIEAVTNFIKENPHRRTLTC